MIQKLKHNKIIRYGASIPLMLLGGYVGYIGNASRNPVILAIAFVLLGVGVLIIWGGLQLGSARKLGKEGKDFKPNSFNIYPHAANFELIPEDKLRGQAVQFLNDKQYYHLHLMKEVRQGEWETNELQLPDDDNNAKYYDPTEFGNPVTMPSSKKCLNWSGPGMQVVSAAVMAVIIVGELIALIAIE